MIGPTATLSIGSALAAVALVFALVQLVAAPWRDLGSATLALGSSALAVRSHPFDDLLLSSAAVIAALAWWRGERAGVGRPGLSGTAIAVATGVLAFDAEVRVVAGWIVAVWCGLFALDRPSPGPRRPSTWSRIQVGGAETMGTDAGVPEGAHRP